MNVVITAFEQNINNVITVHDCFGTHPNNLEKLSNIIKIEFINLYTNEDFLFKFNNRNKQNIIDNGFKILFDESTKTEYVLLKRTKYYLPTPPKLGKLNLDNVIPSKYMIT
jgi:DNA-directed RNA polymerase